VEGELNLTGRVVLTRGGGSAMHEHPTALGPPIEVVARLPADDGVLGSHSLGLAAAAADSLAAPCHRIILNMCL
jgi:hypothetical protein